MAEFDQVRTFIKSRRSHLQADCKHDPGVGPFKHIDRMLACLWSSISQHIMLKATKVWAHKSHSRPGHADHSRDFSIKCKVS